VIDDRARPPSATSTRRQVLRGLGALGLALSLLAEPGLAAAGVAEPRASIVAATGAAPHQPDPARADPAGDPATAPSVDEAAPPVSQEPSIIALDAAAHEHDQIRFTPGGPVRVPFSPRPDDGWTVDGIAPRRLPASAASGRAMAASSQGAIWAPSSSAPEARPPEPLPSTPGPIDGPAPGPAIAAVPVSALVTTDPLSAPPGATDLRRQVFGFLPYWELSDRSTRLDYRLLSTIAYFGVGADADGDLLKRNRDGSTSVGWAGWTSSRMTSVIEAAHRRGTRVVLTVQAFAWTTNQAEAQSALLGSAAARLKLARQIAAAVRDRGADGANLDFEPLVAGRSDEFVALVRTIRAELTRIARGYQLTFDTTGWIGNYPIEAATAPGAADAIFIMGYDYRTAASGSAGSIAPLGGPTYDLVDTVLAFTDRVPARKLILGVPYYGRAWSTVSAKPRSKTHTGTKYGWSASVTYENAVALAKQHGRRYDRRDASAWIAYKRRTCSASSGCVTTWREVYYDDAQSLRAKYDMINRYGLRGAGIWALGYDGTRPELYGAIVAKFLHDTTAPETGIDVLAARQGDEGFTVTWSAQDMNPIRSYDVQVSVDGGRWKSWFTRTRATEATLLGRDGHGYAFRARATDAKGNRGRWNIASLPSPRPTVHKGGFATVKAATLTVRSRPDTAAPTVAKLESGDIVAITGGPVQADGYAWYQVSGPLQTWAPTEPVRTGNWVAGKDGSVAYLVGRTPPNTTIVEAGIAGLSFGADGRASLGPSPAAHAARAFSPNGDGSEDRLTIRWTNGLALDSLTLKVLRADGSTVGTRGVSGVGRGPQAWAWDGTVDGHRLVDGRYVLQLIGTAGSRTFRAPSARPMTPAQVALYAVTVDTIGPRLTGATATGRLVSPLRDGRHDAIAVSAASVGATRWRLTAAPLTGGNAGAPVRTVYGAGGAPRTSWDGRTDARTPARDGRYRVTIAVLDAAGNFESRAWDVVVDGTAPTTAFAASPPSFSPNGDGVADATVIGWTAGERAATTVRIYRGKKLVRTFSVAGSKASGAIRWTGRSGARALLGDGTYQARITVQDEAGNRRTSSIAVRIDRTAGWLRWAPGAFYPQDLDALARTARASFKLTRAATTTLQIVDLAGHPVRIAWASRRQKPGTVRWTWDGRDRAGRMVAPGTYSLVLTAASGVGTTSVGRTVVVDAFVVSLSATRLKPGRTLVVSFATVEGLSTRPVVTFDQTGRAPLTRFATLVGPGRYTISFKVAAGGSGPATVKISARDSAGRPNATSRRVTIQ
jgi:spore germination protein YaaH/flagellar hook assembly protein FlgD